MKEDESPLWFTHHEEKIDLAILPINHEIIQAAQIDYYFFNSNDLFEAREFEAKNIFTGDGLFVLAFPMGISGKARNFVIVRKGIIARVDEEVLGDGYYYIDASAYPGNSGGPVIFKPDIVAIEGTQNNPNAGLIGVVSAGETYREVAISQQTGEARVIFTEQTGLVRVVPVEYIFDIINSIPEPVTAENAKVEDIGLEKED